MSGRASTARQRRPPAHAPKQAVDERGTPLIIHDKADGRSFSVRFSAAVWTSVADCDETFNYWEPLHWILYGNGQQTWEYAPQFALRSYAYVVAHAAPAWIFDRVLHPHRMFIFYFLRCLLALASSCSEVYFANGLRREVGANVARLTLAFNLISAGFFASSAAFLPSTTSMTLTMLAYGAWMRRKHMGLAVLAVALSTLFSWPFAGLLGLPIALDILFFRGHVRRGLAQFLKLSAASFALVALPMIAVDTHFYGRFVLAPANIILYNIFSSHGPNLYGVEDYKFYLFNGFLNFNVVFLLALVVWPIQLLAARLLPTSRTNEDIPRWFLISGLYLWLAVFLAQPHKEERFLFPVYPLITLAAAMTLDNMQKLFFRLFVKVKTNHYLSHTNWMSGCVLFVFSLLSVSRIIAVYVNYGGATNTWIHVSHLPYSDTTAATSDAVNVCLGKEWHRFPASFFLPNDQWHLRFLRSEFQGQLPQPYLPGLDAAKTVRDSFNDANREENNRYEVSLEECHFLVDLDKPDAETKLEPRFSLDTDRWETVISYPFLNVQASSRLFRAFYFPFLSEANCKFDEYLLLKNKNVKLKKEQKEKRRKVIHHL